jgi:hypothetical protein
MARGPSSWAARNAAPKLAPMVLEGITWDSPVMSETICVHRSPRVPPPTATTRSMLAPACSMTSMLWRTARPVASSAAR